jgi:hypothetical protein
MADFGMYPAHAKFERSPIAPAKTRAADETYLVRLSPDLDARGLVRWACPGSMAGGMTRPAPACHGLVPACGAWGHPRAGGMCAPRRRPARHHQARPARPGLAHLIEIAGELQRRGVDLVVPGQGIDTTTTAAGRMFFQILGAIAWFEHALMSERTMDALAAAGRAAGPAGRSRSSGRSRSGSPSRCTTRPARTASGAIPCSRSLAANSTRRLGRSG